MTKVVAIVQARMGSARLPGKVLIDIEGVPMLARVLARLGRADRLDTIAVATSDLAQDDRLADWCVDNGWPLHRGPHEDVLARYHAAAAAETADVVVRITADCPLIDPALVDQVVQTLGARGAAYASNAIEPRTFPRGLDVEAFTRQALDTAHAHARDPASREHVTPYIRKRPDLFPQAAVRAPTDYARVRWTVDTVEDLELVRTIYAHFGHDRFSWQEALAAYKEHPTWARLNAHVSQKGAP